MSDPYASQRAVLRALFAAHPRVIGIDDLVAQVPEFPLAREALRVLIDDGLVNRLGDRVNLSRAAVAFRALAPL